MSAHNSLRTDDLGRASSETTKAERTRQRIVAAAAHELAQHGYGGTSLRKVAAGANLHIGSLYFHFATKDELVAEAMREGVDYAISHVEAALANLPARASATDRLRTALAAHLDALHDSHDRGAAVVRMAETLPPDLRLAQAAHERRYGRLWLGLITSAQSAGDIDPGLDARVLRDIVLGALNNTLSTPPRETLGWSAVVTVLTSLLTSGR